MTKNIDKPIDSENEAYANNMTHIKGWGIDANPKNDPTYPMRQRREEHTKRFDWARPELQSSSVEILQSNERPNLTAVFGTSSPPSGLSGMIRRFAFRYSEGKIRHWLSLLLADRVNVIEGVFTDVSKGQVPNMLKERGIAAEWKHKPEAVVTRVVIGVAVVAGLAIILNKKK